MNAHLDSIPLIIAVEVRFYINIRSLLIRKACPTAWCIKETTQVSSHRHCFSHASLPNGIATCSSDPARGFSPAETFPPTIQSCMNRTIVFTWQKATAGVHRPPSRAVSFRDRELSARERGFIGGAYWTHMNWKTGRTKGKNASTRVHIRPCTCVRGCARVRACMRRQQQRKKESRIVDGAWRADKTTACNARTFRAVEPATSATEK